MKVAVTGASGFIGRHVAQALLERGVEVIACARDTARLGALPASARRVRLDIAEPTASDYDRLQRPDLLLHLAWDGLPNYRSPHHEQQELPRQYAFLRGLVASGLPALLVTGTCFEYGMQSGALSEDAPAQPANPYGQAKHSLHRQLELLRQQHPFAFTWARLFYMYGDGQSPQSLYPALRTAAARGDARFPMSGGEQLRDYLPVEEVARTLVRLALLPQGAGTVNVCSGRPVTVRSLVEGWISEHGWAITPEFGRYPYPDHEPMAFWGERTRLDAVLAAEAPK